MDKFQVTTEERQKSDQPAVIDNINSVITFWEKIISKQIKKRLLVPTEISLLTAKSLDA